MSDARVDLSFIVQAEEQPGVTARLYLITGIKLQELAPAQDCATDAVQASWFPLRQVFDSDPEGSGALVAPFLIALHRWLDRSAEAQNALICSQICFLSASISCQKQAKCQMQISQVPLTMAV